MRSISQIVSVLRPSELALIRLYLKRRSNDEPKLRLELLDLAVENRSITDKEAKNQLPSDFTASAFSHLKERLKRDMLNAILWQESSKRFPESYMAASFECSKNIAQGYLLLMRGAIDEAMKLLNRADKLARDHELVGERVILNQLIRRNLRTITSAKQLEEMNGRIRDDLEQLNSLNRTEELSMAIAAPHLFKGKKIGSEVELDEDLIADLRSGYDSSGLSRSGFWYLMAATEYYTMKNEHERALSYGLQFLDLVKSNKAIFSKPNLAGVSQTVGVSQLFLRDFTKASKNFKTSVENFRNGGMNQLNSLELMFKANLAKPSITSAESCLDQAFEHPIVKRRPEIRSKWVYYHACHSLLSGKPDLAFSDINSTVEITKGKDPYSVWFRIVEIMTMVELEDFDWVEFKYDTLRKFLGRNRKLRNQRVNAILSIISSLMRNGFKLSATSKSSKRELENLINEEEGYEWNPEGAEVVRFDEWVQRKLS